MRVANPLLALLALCALSPVMLLIAAAVRLTGAGPVIYRESRLGRGGHAFRLYKFRSLHESHVDARFVAPVGDPRITGVGGYLRRFHLDELPQLVNIIHGDMNFVGPRPARPELWRGVAADLRDRALAFRPGLTSPASLRFICEDEILARVDNPEAIYRDIIFPAKVAEDVEYFERGARRDLDVVCRTFAAVFRQSGDTDCRERVTRLLNAVHSGPAREDRHRPVHDPRRQDP